MLGGGTREQARGVFLISSTFLPAVLGKAVHSLSRIGDELYLEPLKDGVRDGLGWGGFNGEWGA